MKKYIEIIEYYQDLLRIVRDYHYDYCSISEYDSVYQDILDYQEDNFKGWYSKDFCDFIDYLKKLIVGGVNNVE